MSKAMNMYNAFEMPGRTVHITEVYDRSRRHVATIQRKIGGNCFGELILNSALPM